MFTQDRTDLNRKTLITALYKRQSLPYTGAITRVYREKLLRQVQDVKTKDDKSSFKKTTISLLTDGKPNKFY